MDARFRTAMIPAAAVALVIALVTAPAVAQGCQDLAGRWPYGAARPVTVAGGCRAVIPITAGGNPTAVCDIGSVELAGAGELTVATFESGYLPPGNPR